MLNYSVVIPTFKASEALAETLLSLHALLSSIEGSFEIVVVVDGGDPEIVTRLQALALDNVQVHVLTRRVGTWACTTAGLNRTRGKLLITVDDDGEYPSEAVSRVIDYYQANDFPVVFGLARDHNDGLGIRLRRWVQDTLAGQKRTSSLRVIDREAVRFPLPSWLYIDAYLNWRLPKTSIGRVAVPHNRKTVRTKLAQKLILFMQAFLCYRRTLALTIALLTLLAFVICLLVSNILALLLIEGSIAALLVLLVRRWATIRKLTS